MRQDCPGPMSKKTRKQDQPSQKTSTVQTDAIIMKLSQNSDGKISCAGHKNLSHMHVSTIFTFFFFLFIQSHRSPWANHLWAVKVEKLSLSSFIQLLVEYINHRVTHFPPRHQLISGYPVISLQTLQPEETRRRPDLISHSSSPPPATRLQSTSYL